MDITARSAPIEQLTVAAYTVPTDLPEADGTIEWDSTTMVLVRLRADDHTGLGYTYADKSAALVIEGLLAPLLIGANPLSIPATVRSMWRRVRNNGASGITAMAISAVDCALWDLKARLLGIPLITLLGAVRDSVPVYGSGGFTSYTIEQLQDQLARWVESGISQVKMKIGTHPEDDLERVRQARNAIGAEAALFVDANGAYTPTQSLNFAERFREFGVVWFEEPVPSSDLAGLHRIRKRAPAGMDIAAGEYGCEPAYFRAMLQAGAVDVLQADATRCGGISGFLSAGALAAAFTTPLSAHTAPSLHVHVCCALQPVRHIEYFHDHVRIEHVFFDGAATAIDGQLRPNLDRPGLGLEFRSAEAAPYRVYESRI